MHLDAHCMCVKWEFFMISASFQLLDFAFLSCDSQYSQQNLVLSAPTSVPILPGSQKEFLQEKRQNRGRFKCCSSIMAADNVAEMSIFSKVDHFYSCGWDAMVLGNETATFLENQTKLNSSDSGLAESMPMITSVGEVDESCSHPDFFQDRCQSPSNAKRKRNVSSSKNSQVDEKQTVDAEEKFVHIRAKKGQATSNHSLAERVRRERISERMRLLQELVPGCDKITGKAVVLDEIINYVQSLQQQVEFLSMKLATVDPELNLDIQPTLSTHV